MRPIDADALIEKCGDWYVEEGTESGFIGTLKNLLATEPTIQPQSTAGQLNDGARSTVQSTDLIDRQQAIDAANDWYEGLICGSINGLIKRLNALPSVQPEPSTNCSEIPNSSDTISRQAAIDALEQIFDRCEEIEAHLPEGDPDRTGYKMYPDYMTVWKYLHQLPSAQPKRTCVNCGRTVNNGGWYADGRTRCPIEEHYALPKDGYCHLWEKRNVTDDDYPERREE